jgi:peptidyl-prolyl cis-trans isomerase C
MFDQKLLFALFSVLLMGLAFSVSARAAGDNEVLAEVNGNKITKAMLDRYQLRRGMPSDADPAQQTQAMIEELINRELIYQDAVKKGLDKNAEVKAEIDNQRVNIIASAMLKQTSEKNVISDEKLKAAYDQHVKQLSNIEFHAKHILLENEKDANDVIAELKKGTDFSELAKSKSTGPSKDSGGDLGWFSPQQMVKPFSDAVAKMKIGEYSQAPVKTQFGWHVIKLEETRQIPPPAFDDLKQQLQMRLQNQGIESYIATLRKKAKITKK